LPENLLFLPLLLLLVEQLHLATHLSALWPRCNFQWTIRREQRQSTTSGSALTQNWKLCGRRFSRKKHALNKLSDFLTILTMVPKSEPLTWNFDYTRQ